MLNGTGNIHSKIFGASKVKAPTQDVDEAKNVGKSLTYTEAGALWPRQVWSRAEHVNRIRPAAQLRYESITVLFRVLAFSPLLRLFQALILNSY